MGKKSGRGASKDYFGNVPGLVCAGPLHGVVCLLYGEKVVWPPTERWEAKTWDAGSIVAQDGAIWETSSSTSAVPPAAPWTRFIRLRATESVDGNPTQYTAPGYGDFWVLWGTATQTLSGDAATVLDGHPAYRRQAGLVLHRWKFGTNVKTPSNTSLIYTRVPEQSLITGSATDLDAEFQCNPWCVLAEYLTHPVWGLGLPVSAFDAAAWQTVADWAEDHSSLTYISPQLTRPTGLRSLVADLLAYCAGFLRWDSQGRIQAGRWLVNEAPPVFTAGTTIDFHDAVDDPEWTAGSLHDIATAAEVAFTDAAAAFKARSMTAPNALATLLTRRMKVRKVQRPHIVRAGQALAVAQQESLLFGRRTRAGQIAVRAEKATAIRPGTSFLLTHDALGQSIVARCNEKRFDAPPGGEVTLSWEEERGLGGSPYVPTIAPRNPAGPPGLARPQHCQFIGIPNDLYLLCARTEPTLSRVDILFRKDEGAAFQPLAAIREFAVSGTVQVAAGSGDATVRMHIDPATPPADFDAVNTSQTADEVNDDTLLLIVIRAGAPVGFEIMSVSGLTAAGGGNYDVAVTRGRRGTTGVAWEAGRTCYLVYRADLVAFTHARFASLFSGTDTATFRLVPNSAWRSADPEDVYHAGTNPSGLTTEVTIRFGLPDFDPLDFAAADLATI